MGNYSKNLAENLAILFSKDTCFCQKYYYFCKKFIKCRRRSFTEMKEKVKATYIL
jgi:hypothetical protein